MHVSKYSPKLHAHSIVLLSFFFFSLQRSRTRYESVIEIYRGGFFQSPWKKEGKKNVSLFLLVKTSYMLIFDIHLIRHIPNRTSLPWFFFSFSPFGSVRPARKSTGFDFLGARKRKQRKIPNQALLVSCSHH